MTAAPFRRGHIHAPTTLADSLADKVANFSGSWTFVGLHVAWWVLWIFVLRVEPFPFGLLTMLLSLEAIVLSTLVLMTQTREGAKNKVRDGQEAQEVSLLYQMNKRQTQMLLEITALKEEMRCKGCKGGPCCYGDPLPTTTMTTTYGGASIPGVTILPVPSTPVSSGLTP